MGIASVFATVGFATGAGSGVLAGVGCGVSDFLSPHIMASSVKDTFS